MSLTLSVFKNKKMKSLNKHVCMYVVSRLYASILSKLLENISGTPEL